MYENFTFKSKHPIALVEISRAKKFNTLSPQVWKEMEALVDEIEGDSEIRCVIITGEGGIFSAGADIGFLKETSSKWALKNLPWLQRLYSRIENLHQPVIAAINGKCLGAGAELALSCDIRIADTDSVYWIPEIQFGLSTDMGASQRLGRIVGPSQAKRLLLGCEKIDANEAFRIGLIDELVEPDQLIDRAMQLAKNIAAKPMLPTVIAKMAVNLSLESSMQAGLIFEKIQATYCLGTKDKDEAVEAFFEKRAPIFTNEL